MGCGKRSEVIVPTNLRTIFGFICLVEPTTLAADLGLHERFPFRDTRRADIVPYVLPIGQIYVAGPNQ